MEARRTRRRKVRKVVAYVCTGCYKTFPSGGEASAHYRARHPAPAKPAGRPGRPRGPRGRRRRGRR